jgi:glycosyltransferase involved in cell wall biosynthesis
MPLHNPFYLNKAYSKPLSYMACALPVVASPIPSYRELIRDRVDGILAETSKDWVEALLLLVGSEKLRQKLGQAGRQRLLESHSEEIVARKFAGVFEQALELHRRQVKARQQF